MKIEIEIPDLEEIYCNYYDDNTLRGKELKEIIVDIAIEKFVDQLYDDYISDQVYVSIKNEAKEIVKSRSSEIVDKVVAKVSD